jgi:hypothetical protein
MKRIAALALVSLVAAACTAIAGLEPLELVDLSDATGDGGGGGEGGVADARLEATPEDGSILDGGDADARVSTSCALVDAEFCDDFDHGQPFSVRWSSLQGPQGPCSLATSMAEARSGLTSVRVESLTDPQNVAVAVALGKVFPAFQGNYSVSFDVLFKVAPNNGVFVFQGGLTPTYGNNNDAVNPMIAVFGADDGGSVDITAFNLRPFSGNQGELLANVPLGQWVHVEASVRRDADAAATNVRFRAAGGTVVTRQIATEAPVTTPGVSIGLNSGGVMVELFIDNVVMDTR